MGSYSEKYNRLPWMTDDQWECACLVADLWCGFHHVCAKFKEYGDGIEVNIMTHRLATFDFDGLTKLVLLAHDRMIRAAICGSSPGRVKLCLWKRHKRKGAMNERHPTIEQALAVHRRNFIEKPEVAAPHSAEGGS